MVEVLLTELVELSNEQYKQLANWANMQRVVLKHLQALHKRDAMA
jgi:hypothetical protein